MPIRQHSQSIPQVDRDEVLDKEFDELEPHERRWLQDTSHWPEDAPKEPVTFHMPGGGVVSNDPAYLLANADQGNPALQALIESRARDLAREMAQASIAEQSTTGEYSGNALGQPAHTEEALRRARAQRGAPESSNDDEGLAYDQMGVQELRGEALSRGISIEGENGRKANLIANLQADDELKAQEEQNS